MENFYFNLNQIKSNPDGEPTVNRQSRLMSYRGNLKNLAMIFAVLVLSVGQMWGEDITITPIYTGSYLSPGNLVKVTMGSNTSVSSGAIQVSKNTNGSFTISTSAPGMYLKSATFTDDNNGSTKAVTNLACTNGNIENSSGTCTYTANASTTSTTISFTGNTGGAVKLGSLSVVVTNGSLNNMETLSGFSCSSGTFSFTSKVNGSTVTSAVSLTTQTSSSWGASNGIMSIPSNASKTLTITSSNNIRYVAILDDNCRLTLEETSSTGGTCNGASWTAPSGVVNSVTFKSTVGATVYASKVFVITEATSTYGIARVANSWNASNELMSGSGTVSRTLTLSANTNYEFKIVNTEGGGTWYGNGETWGGNRTQSVSSTGTANNCHLLTTDAGVYTFEFNTSTKDLTITYPNSYTYYYANTNSWSKVCVYKYTSISSTTGKSANWPGTEIASPSFTCGGVDYYEASSSGYKTIIFNNGVNGGGDEKKTGNMTVSSSDEGKYVGGTGSSWSAMPTYTVTYNKNGDGAGGAGSVTGSVPTDASSPYSCGSDVTVKGEGNLALAGYYFNGWNTAAGGGGDSYAEGETISGISANTILYAQWEAIPTYDVEFALTDVSYSSGTDEGEDVAAYNSDYSVTFEADPGFLLPDEITVTIDGDEVTEDTEYTWDQATGEVVVDGAYITGKIVITVVADEGPDNYWNEFVWKANSDYGGDGKCMNTSDANTASILTSGVITAAQSTATIVGGKDLKMDRPASAGTEFRLTFAVTQPGYYISFVCTYGKIEEEKGADYSWDGGTNWTHITKYTSETTESFDAPDGTYPTSFIIHYTLETAGAGGIYWRNAQLELAKIPTCSTPDAPTNFTAGSITATGLTFSITDEADAESYDIYYSTDDDEPDGSTDATTTSTSKSKDVTGLNMGTTYYAWVRAVCDDDHKSDWVELNPAGDTHTFTTSCVAPSALAAASPTAKGVTLSVTDANDVNDYEFYVSEDDEEPVANATATHSVTSSKSLTITNLVAGTTYYAWARSKCSANKSSWTALTNSTFTTSTVTVTHTLNNVTETSSAATSGVGGSDYTAVYAADEDYSLPTPVVTIDGNTATSGTDYTWVAGTGTITIPANKINGNIVITMNSAKAAPSSVSISGNYHIYPGDDLELTATPTGGNGPKTYQWQKYVDSDWENIDDETSATYTKANVTTSDVGHYRCIVTCAGTESTASGQYDVKCLQLYVYYNDNKDLTNLPLTKVDGTHATATVLLSNGTYDYRFKITDGCGNWWGNNGASGMSMSNHDNWPLNGNHYTILWTSKAGTYRFNLGHDVGLTSYGMSVVFPSGTQAAGYNLYFANDETEWNGSKIYYRIGKTSHNNFLQMNLVPGTANLYKVTTTEYGGFEAWHIANNRCGGNSTSIYKTNTNDDYEASAAMMFNGTDIASTGLTVIPDVNNHWAGTGDGADCEFYGYNTVDGMKTDRVTISDYSNGTITVNYTNTSNVTSTLTSGYADLAHTVILSSITAVADEGYDASAVTINGGDYSANYVVTGATTIAATFSPQTYTITYKDQGDVEFSGTHETGYPTTHTYATGTTLKSASKTGYTFDGWFTTNACTGDPIASIGATDITANTTLYAKWTADSYTITLNKGDHGAANQSASVSYDATSLTSITHVTSTGYDRTGYYDGETKVLNADGSFAGDNITGYITSGKWSKTSDATLTAKWSANQYSVSHSLSHATKTSGATGANAATYGTDYTAVFAASSGYALPNSVTVTAGGSNITANCTYTKATGTVLVPGSYITGNIVITVTGVATFDFRMIADADAESELNLANDEAIEAGKKNCTTISGGTAVYSGSGMKVQKGTPYGWYFGSNSDIITITLSGKVLQTGSTITIYGYSADDKGFAINGVTTVTNTTGNTGAFNGTYTVQSTDADLINKNELAITRVGSSAIRMYSISISNCATGTPCVTPVLPSLTTPNSGCTTGDFAEWDASVTNSAAISAASGDQEVTYSWTNSSSVEVGTDATFTPTSAGTYTVTVTVHSETSGYIDATATSSTLTASLYGNPSVTGPSDANYVVGASASNLSVTATPTHGESLTYQWYSNTAKSTSSPTPTALENCTTSTYKPSTAAAGTTYYFCKVSGGCEDVYSSIATVTVTEAPCLQATITKSSGSYTVTSGTPQVITSDATITSGGTVTLVNNYGSDKTYSFSDDGVSISTSSGYVEITLPSGFYTAVGSVIRVTGKGGASDEGLSLIDDNGDVVQSGTANGAIDFTYTVIAASTIKNKNHIRINRAKTSGTNIFKSVTITGCDECTPITSPTLSYDKTMFWMDDATLTATPTLDKGSSTGSVTYASSDATIVSVNESTGAIEALKAGTVTITAAIATDGTYCADEATCTITVKSGSCGYGMVAEAVLNGTTSTSSLVGGTLIASNLKGDSPHYKLNKAGAKFGITISGSFSEGDSIIFSGKMDASATTTSFWVFPNDTATTAVSAIYTTTLSNSDSIDAKFVVTADMLTALNSSKTVAVVRQSSINQNPHMKFVRIKRYTCPDGMKEFLPTGDNGNWNATANWIGTSGRGASLPGISDRVIVSKPVTVNVATAKAERVEIGENASVTIAPTGGLVVATMITKDGSATTPSDLIIESSDDGTGALITGEESTTTQATVGFYTKAIKHATRGYVNQYIGIPFTGITAYDRFYDTYVYEYIASSNAWSVLENNGSMSPFTAYNLMRDEDTETTLYSGGTLILPGTTTHKDKEFELTLRNASATTTNMFANPYTAPIDITALDEDDDFTGIEATIYLFNAGSNYDVSNRSGQTGGGAGQWLVLPVASVKDAPGSYAVTTIPSQQAFMVKGTTGASHTMTIDYKKHVYDPAKTSGATINPARAPKQDREETALETMNLTVQGLGGASDRVLIFMREDFTTGFDNGWDGRKMKGKTYAPYFYAATDDGKMAVNSVPTAEGTVLGFKAGTEDNFYTFSFEYDGEDIWYLNDLKEQKSTLIDAANTYIFESEVGDAEARFVISATPINKVSTGNEDVGAEAAKVRKVIINDHIYIIRGGRMYSVDGALVR